MRSNCAGVFIKVCCSPYIRIFLRIDIIKSFRYVTSKILPTPYKVKTPVLVGIQYVSYFNPNFLYQHTIVNQSYRDLQQFEGVCEESMPEMLLPYAIAKEQKL